MYLRILRGQTYQANKILSPGVAKQGFYGFNTRSNALIPASSVTHNIRPPPIDPNIKLRLIHTTPFQLSQSNFEDRHQNQQNTKQFSITSGVFSLLKWSGILFATTVCAITFGVAIRQENTEYSLPKRMLISFDSIIRFLRTAVAGLIVSLDYKFIYNYYDKTDPDWRGIQSRLHKRSAERVLRLCMKNGGVYVKGGQYLASLNHVFPKEVTETLSVLQDKAPNVEYHEVVKIFMEDLGHPPEFYFSEFDKTPIAAASLAQVHRALLPNGQECAVKVQYPTIKDRFKGDMWSHDFCLLMIQTFFPNFGEVTWMGEEIRENLAKELDFINEAANAARAKNNLKSMKNVYVPSTFKELTTKRILTMEYVHGVKITNIEAIKKLGLSMSEVAQTMIEIFARQIFCYGFVHCDPHPGNLLVRKAANGKNAEVVLLDHGLYRDLPENFRKDFCQVWRALILRDEKKLKKHSVSLGVKNYDLFAVILLMRSYKGGNVGLSNKMSRQEIKELFHGMRDKMPELMEVMKDMPRELLLILRNFNLVRSINKELGAPVNRFVITARVAAEGISLSENNEGLPMLQRIRNIIHSKKNAIIFDLHIYAASIISYLIDMYLATVKRVGGNSSVMSLEEIQEVIMDEIVPSVVAA